MSRLKDYFERKDRTKKEKRLTKIQKGECICRGWNQGGMFEFDWECPQVDEHFRAVGLKPPPTRPKGGWYLY